MKPSFLTSLLTSVGGLALTVGALLWPTVSQAQGFCYMVDANGRVTNLDDLCGSSRDAQVPSSQGATTSQSEITGAESAQPSATPPVRGFTIIGSPTDSDPSEAAVENPNNSVDPESTGNEPTGNEPVGNEPRGNEPIGEDPAVVEPAGRQSRPGIPVEEITIPGIEVPQIQAPAEPNSSTSNPETNDSETNGNVIRNIN